MEKENVLEPKDNLSKEAIKNPLQQKKKVRKYNHIIEIWSFFLRTNSTDKLNQSVNQQK